MARKAPAATKERRTSDGSMVPIDTLLVTPSTDSRLTPAAKPVPEFREHLRKIPSWRNALSVVLLYAATVGVIALAVWADNPIIWVLAFLAMGPVICRYNILMHE